MLIFELRKEGSTCVIVTTNIIVAYELEKEGYTMEAKNA